MALLQYLLAPAQCLLRSPVGSSVAPSALHVLRPPITSRMVTTQQRAPPKTPREPDRLAEFTRDEQIDTNMVQVKSDDGGVGEPQMLKDILQGIDRRSHCVIQLSKAGERDAAVVQVRAKMDLLKQLRDRENQQRQVELAKREKKPKQIELNWAISENDLNLKLKQMEAFLDKGKTVEILLAAKKRQRKASEDEGIQVLKKIRQAVQDIGAKEVKSMQGQVLRQATMIIKR